MPWSNIISIELFCALIISVIVGAILIKRQKRLVENKQKEIRGLKRKIVRLQARLKVQQESITTLSKTLSKEEEPRAETDNLKEVADMMGQLQADFTGGDERLDELQNAIDQQHDIISLLQDINTKKVSAQLEHYRKKIAQLNQTVQLSEATVNRIRQNLDGARDKVATLSMEVKRSAHQQILVRALEDRERQLLQDRKKLHETVIKQKQQQRNSLNIIHSLEKRERQILRDRKKLQAKIQHHQTQHQEHNAIIAGLTENIQGVQEQALRDEEAADLNVEHLKTALQDACEALDRAVTEKDFIESHFIELDEQLSEGEKNQEKLQSAKNELETLDDIVLGLDESSKVSEECLDDGAECESNELIEADELMTPEDSSQPDKEAGQGE